MKLRQMKQLFLLTILIMMVGCQPFDKHKNVIYLVGDSTMATKKEDRRPETGWGEMLPNYFQNGVQIENHAVNGRSTKSFRDEGRWQTIVNKLQKNDMVFIQFGHNDSKVNSPDRYASPTQYYQNLIDFVEDVQSKDAIPVILTLVVRRRFNDDGQLYRSHGDYPEMARKAAAEKGVVLIDMQAKSEKLLIETGESDSEMLYLWLDEGVNDNYPEGVADNTHFSAAGAEIMAGLVVEGIKNTDLAINKYLKSL